MRESTSRDRSPKVSGGRWITSHGYIRVSAPWHPRARGGLVYEHRLVAEWKIGRQLRPGEEVHHINGNKRDNRPENLEVCESHAHHATKHRKRTDKRDPGAPNPNVSCACGCGTLFSRFDAWDRPRRFVTGHNPPPPLKTHCKHGHEFTPENTQIQIQGSYVNRKCRTCKRERERVKSQTEATS